MTESTQPGATQPGAPDAAPDEEFFRPTPTDRERRHIEAGRKHASVQVRSTWYTIGGYGARRAGLRAVDAEAVSHDVPLPPDCSLVWHLAPSGGDSGYSEVFVLGPAGRVADLSLCGFDVADFKAIAAKVGIAFRHQATWGQWKPDPAGCLNLAAMHDAHPHHHLFHHGDSRDSRDSRNSRDSR